MIMIKTLSLTRILFSMILIQVTSCRVVYALMAEFVGTTLLVLVGCGSTIGGGEIDETPPPNNVKNKYIW